MLKKDASADHLVQPLTNQLTQTPLKGSFQNESLLFWGGKFPLEIVTMTIPLSHFPNQEKNDEMPPATHLSTAQS